MTVATLSLLWAAAAGLYRATGRPPAAGVSIALEADDTGVPGVVVRNEGVETFEGDMVVDGKATSTALRIAPGEALRISFPADDRCPDERVVSIDGPGAPTASVVVPCPGAGT